MLVNLIDRLRGILSPTIELNSHVPIGIYGSFDPENRVFLESLRNFLNDNGYLAYISEDLQKFCPNNGDYSKNKYNICISELMTEMCQIHIAFYFKADEKDPAVNESVVIELESMKTKDQKHVMIFHEEGSLEQAHSLLKGIMEQNIEDWCHDDFTRTESYGDDETPFLDTGLMFCKNRIISNPGLGYASQENFEEEVAKKWEKNLGRFEF